MIAKQKREKEKRLEQKRNKRRKIGYALFTLALLIALAAVASWYGSQEHPNAGPVTTFQDGVLANDTKTFTVDYEWNWMLEAGKRVSLTLTFEGGVGVDAVFSMNDANHNLVTPYLFSVQPLNVTDPAKTWSGVLTTSGSYRLELGNKGDENSPVTLRVLAEAT